MACVRDDCARICEVKDCRKMKVSFGGHLSRRADWGVLEEWEFESTVLREKYGRYEWNDATKSLM